MSETAAAAAALHRISSREHREQFPTPCHDCRDSIEGLAASGFHVLNEGWLRKAALCDRLAELLDAVDRDTAGPASPNAPYVGSPLEAQIRLALNAYRSRNTEAFPGLLGDLEADIPLPTVRLAADNLSLAIERFARHCESRNIKVPLWAGLLWDEVISSQEAYRVLVKTRVTA